MTTGAMTPGLCNSYDSIRWGGEKEGLKPVVGLAVVLPSGSGFGFRQVNRPTTTQRHLAKTFYACLVYDVGTSWQTSRVRQGQDHVCHSKESISSFSLKRWL